MFAFIGELAALFLVRSRLRNTTSLPFCKFELEVNGTITTKQLIIANENQKQDLIAILNELKNEIGQLKEQINQLTKN